YLSRVFPSKQDGKYKFAASTRVGGRELVGLLAATVAIDSRLVALDLREEQPGAAVVSPMDWSRGAPTGIDTRDHVGMLHAEYDGSGERPLWVEGALSEPLRRFAEDPTLRETTLRLTDDGGFVDYARVGDTHFVVMAPRPYPRPLSWVLRPRSLVVLAAL